MRTKGSVLFAFSVWLAFSAVSAQTPATQTGAPPAAEPLTTEMRGDIAMARKNYRDAIDYYRKAPPSALVLNKIGIAYHQQNDFNQARKYYERSIKKNPQYSEAVNTLGTVYYARKNYRRAVAQYNKALKISPDSASVYSNLGTAYFSRKQYKEASEAYRKAVSLDPEVFSHRNSFGVLMQSINVEERAQFHYYLAKTYAQAGMNDQAIQYIRKAIEEGFKDKKKFIEDPEFAKLQELDEFKEAIAAEPRVL